MNEIFGRFLDHQSVSSKTGLNVEAFFSRLAALTFNASVLQECQELDTSKEIGNGGLLSIQLPYFA